MDTGTARKGYLLLGRKGMYGLWAGTSLVVGADQQCNICIDLDHVSRRHCGLYVDEHDRCFVLDLGSTNGTLVNGQHLVAQVGGLLGGSPDFSRSFAKTA